MKSDRENSSRRIVFVLWLIFIFLNGAVAQGVEADLVVINARVYTIDARKPRAEAIAVRRNKITAVGGLEEIKKLIGAETKTIDAGGRTVIPGFNDAHVHFLAMGNQFSSIDLRDARTAQEFVERIKFYVQFLPRGRWILGGGWNHDNWTPVVLPTAALIDAVTPDNPVLIYHADGKTALANSLALQIAGFDREIKKPDGILTNAALLKVKSFTPRSNTADRLAAAEDATNYAAFSGVTSVQDMSEDDNLEVLRELERRGKLKTRVYDCTNLLKRPKRAEAVPRRSTGSAMIRGGCLKSFAEGESDEMPVLYREILAADRAGEQVMMHAVGALANDSVLSIFERVSRERPRRDRRFRVEHAHNFRPQDARRFGKSKIIASLQPALFADADGRGSSPLRSLLRSNARLAFGSDASMISVNPLEGIYAAVANRSSEQSITVEEAVRFYTLGAAYAEFQENVKGSLKVGKLADIVILSDDIFTIEKEKIRQTKVFMTIVDGRVVYERK